MGYTTEFTGDVSVNPPLNAAEIEYLQRFSRTRHMDRELGPYFADGASEGGDKGDVRDTNRPCAGVPGLWCKWVPTEDGGLIEWNGGESFYDPVEWMRYLIDHFLKPEAVASSVGDPQFNEFTFDHVLNGSIDAQGEEADDIWRLSVKNNVVKELKATISYEDEDDEEETQEQTSLPPRRDVERVEF